MARDRDADELAPGPFGDKYEIVSLLAEGGMGRVYKARQRGLDRLVCLKVVKPSGGLDGELIKRFVREMRVMSRLEHPNIVRVYDWGTREDGLVYLVMELVPGRTLGREIRTAGALGTQRVARIGQQMARALVAAHAEGIIHRDLKPGNVMVRELYGEKDIVQVLDFGIATWVDVDKRHREGLTMTGQYVGTPAYAAPEQAKPGGQVDHRADLYSLGCVLYHAATGRRPFADKAAAAQVFAHLTQSPEPPDRVAPEDVTAELSAVILTLMAKRPGERPQTAAEVVDLLLPMAGVGILAGDAPGLASSDVTDTHHPLPDSAPAEVAAVDPLATTREPALVRVSRQAASALGTPTPRDHVALVGRVSGSAATATHVGVVPLPAASEARARLPEEPAVEPVAEGEDAGDDVDDVEATCFDGDLIGRMAREAAAAMATDPVAAADPTAPPQPTKRPAPLEVDAPASPPPSRRRAAGLPRERNLVPRGPTPLAMDFAEAPPAPRRRRPAPRRSSARSSSSAGWVVAGVLLVGIAVAAWALLGGGSGSGSAAPRLTPDQAAAYVARCDSGDETACLDAAQAYERGVGVERDIERAREYYGRVAEAYRYHCERGRPFYCHALADLLTVGQRVPPDPGQAQQLYAKACRLGHRAACRK